MLILSKLDAALEVVRFIGERGVRAKVSSCEGGFCVVLDKPSLVARLCLEDEEAAREVEKQFQDQGFVTDRRGADVRAYDVHI